MTATRRIILASFPVHVGGAKKWSENEATAMKGWGVLVVHFRKTLCTV